jgi:hypothetical protein
MQAGGAPRRQAKGQDGLKVTKVRVYKNKGVFFS